MGTERWITVGDGLLWFTCTSYFPLASSRAGPGNVDSSMVPRDIQLLTFCMLVCRKWLELSDFLEEKEIYCGGSWQINTDPLLYLLIGSLFLFIISLLPWHQSYNQGLWNKNFKEIAVTHSYISFLFVFVSFKNCIENFMHEYNVFWSSPPQAFFPPIPLIPHTPIYVLFF